MDFGYPQFTEAKILSEYIKTDAHKMEVSKRLSTHGVQGVMAHGLASYALLHVWAALKHSFVTSLELPVI